MNALTPAQVAQEEEARTRTAQLPDGENDQHQTPIDETIGEPDEPVVQPRAAEPDPDPAEPVIRDQRSPADIKRAEMAARFRASREEREGKVPFNGDMTDPEMQFGEFGRQQQEPDDEPSVVGSRTGAPADPEPTAPKPDPAQPKLTKLIIRGEERWMTDGQILEAASKVLAADSYLDQGRNLLEEAKRIRAGERAPSGDQHPDREARTQDDGRTGDATEQDQRPDPLEQAIEEIQFGDPKDAAKKIRKVISDVSLQSATEGHTQRLMDNELARSQAALRNFADQNPDIAKDDNASAVMLNNMYAVYREDLIKSGIEESKLPTDRETLANWHRFSRVNGKPVRQIEEVFKEASSRYHAWKGDSKPAGQTQVRTQQPRVEVDRTERRLAIPNQPSRGVTPRPDAVRQPATRKSGSDIVKEMRRARGQLVAD